MRRAHRLQTKKKGRGRYDAHDDDVVMEDDALKKGRFRELARGTGKRNDMGHT